VNRRATLLLTALAALLLLLPSFASSYILSVATLFLFFAYTGQAWNILMGFAGQLSLGHSLYLGVGAYAAAALYFHFGIGPWAGLWIAIMLCVLLGAAMGGLGVCAAEKSCSPERSEYKRGKYRERGLIDANFVSSLRTKSGFFAAAFAVGMVARESPGVFCGRDHRSVGLAEVLCPI